MSKSNVVSIQAPVEDSPRQPSPSDKATIRQFLDGHFDDSKGMYLDGCSDEKAGLELNMPWAWVRDIREFAYGPIKVDPEIAALKAEINAISPKIAEISKTIAELSKTAATLMGTVANIAGRIKRLEG